MSATTTATGTVSLIFLADGGSLHRPLKVGYEMTTMFDRGRTRRPTSPVVTTLRRAVQLPTFTVRRADRHLSAATRLPSARQERRPGACFDAAESKSVGRRSRRSDRQERCLDRSWCDCRRASAFLQRWPSPRERRFASPQVCLCRRHQCRRRTLEGRDLVLGVPAARQPHSALGSRCEVTQCAVQCYAGHGLRHARGESTGRLERRPSARHTCSRRRIIEWPAERSVSWIAVAAMRSGVR